ncbi:MAG: DUF885 domain-containing protein, partial [Gammaproteobacteria bacterium]|nr:DUF885 domain-containing protein [Gammaproteobacteria bacterium]
YDQIDDASEEAGEQRLQWRAQTVEQLQSNFDYDALSSDAKISYDIWIYQYETARAMAPFRRHNYVFNQMRGSHTSLPNFLINSHTVSNESEMQAYISRIVGIARSIDQSLYRAKLGAEENVRAPRFAYEIVSEQSLALITGAPFDSQANVDAPLWADAKVKIEALLSEGEIGEARARELLSEVEKALLETFEPSYQSLIAWLQEDYQNTSQQAMGVASLNNGDNYYQASLESMTTTTLSADEIHQLGLNEVARIKSEIEIIKQQVGFEGSLEDFFTYTKTDGRFYYPNDDEGRQGYLDDAASYIAVMREKLPDYFGLFPQAELEVRRVEAFREQDGGAAHYRTGTQDGSRPGVYYAHLSDMAQLASHKMEATSYHEGIPGHHMQLSIQRELTGVPEFRKTASFTAYIEGWGLYAELLAKEMGAFEDPYKDFGRLGSEIYRAVRLVLDTGIHAKGWSEEEANTYYRENSALPDGKIRSEVRRYFVMPGQATSYKIGMLKILELREKARSELGEKFDISAFHDTVLGGGALPLSILERVVDNWISEVQA